MSDIKKLSTLYSNYFCYCCINALTLFLDHTENAGMLAMQQLVESMVIEVHVTNQIFLFTPAEKKVDIMFTLFQPSPSSSAAQAAEPQANDDILVASTAPGESSKGNETSANQEIPGGIKLAYSIILNNSDELKKLPESSGKPDDVVGSDVALPSRNGYSEEKNMSSCSSGFLEGKEALSYSPEVKNENTDPNPSGGKDGANTKNVLTEKLPVLQENEVDIDLAQDLSYLAPYMPVVELYTQHGAQVIVLECSDG